MRALQRWTIAAGLAALAGAGAAYVRHGASGDGGDGPAEDSVEIGASDAGAASPDAREALDAARARLRARAEELHREIEGPERPTR
ncbi:MAG: hypothetical protein ACR2N6_05570 [Miltoncostaeaceae bacterium]